MATSYRYIAEIIQKEHYNGQPPAEAPLTIRLIAERVATKVAKYAKRNAYENGNLNETSYANDQFVSVFYSIALQTNATTGDKYIVLPATPAGLYKNTEIVQVSFTGSPNAQVIPMLQKDAFVESLLPPMPGFIVLYKIETGNIVFPGLPKIINSPVNVKMIGSISGPTLLDSLLNVPKDTEDEIILDVLAELSREYGVKPQNLVLGEPAV